VDATALSVVRDVFEEIDANVPRSGREQTALAQELFTHLDRRGGGVEAIGEPACSRTPIADLGRWSEDPWPGATYAIDASTTRPLEYTNGLITDMAYAKLGVGGIDADRTPEQAGTIKAVVYFDDDESTLHGKEFGGEDDKGEGREQISAEIVPFNADRERTRNLSKSVSSVAQSLTEGEHARRQLDAIDGALFLDGSLYPLGVLYWVLLDDAGQVSPARFWELPAEIVENYIEVINTQFERGRPVIGVVKTSTTSQLVEALDHKLTRHDVRTEEGRRPDVPWTRDHQFIGDVLREPSLNHLTYTSWFVSTDLSAIQVDGELLDPFADQLRHGNPGEYRRAFFFVRLPNSEFIFRIEAPLLFVIDDETRHDIQYKALKEIAQRRNVPQSVVRADRIARITTANRKTIRSLLESCKASMDYNEDGRLEGQDGFEGMEIRE
jgi:hypothetical protein